LPITSLWSDQEISSKLSARKLRKINIDNVGRAAVLIPIWKEDESLSFLLTLRTKKVQTHKGQISFPGGMRNSTEEPLVQTALRETQEEIGIFDNQIRILGQFDEYLSTTKLIVTPFVGRIEPPLVIQKNPEEVEEVIKVPFSLFQKPELLRTEIRQRLNERVKVYHYDFKGLDVWGLTAQIIRDFLKVIGLKI
jgi:8-oxo-dGTP pyrophosphatase MutT (NUDIX family)|tara:strand:- start:4 stop:585 length:582 start_codon:yes stop_codon:yes gene_type:complete